MTWFVFARYDVQSNPWVAMELPLQEMAEELPRDDWVDAILSREEALSYPQYREAVLAWDRDDATLMESDLYRHWGADPEQERMEELREIQSTDWNAWRESLAGLTRDREVIEAYWRHHLDSVLGGDTERHFWAWDAIYERLDVDPEGTWLLILDLVHTAPNDGALGYMAAGVLEDFIKEYGSRFIDRIEEEAARSPRFVEALSGVWLNDKDDPDVVTRVSRLVPEEPSD